MLKPRLTWKDFPRTPAIFTSCLSLLREESCLPTSGVPEPSRPSRLRTYTLTQIICSSSGPLLLISSWKKHCLPGPQTREYSDWWARVSQTHRLRLRENRHYKDFYIVRDAGISGTINSAQPGTWETSGLVGFGCLYLRNDRWNRPFHIRRPHGHLPEYPEVQAEVL